jgi:hypothetical protein
VVDTDWYVEDPQPQAYVMQRGRGKAALARHRRRSRWRRRSALGPVRNATTGLLHDPASREPISHRGAKFDRADRSSALQGLGEYPTCPAPTAQMVSLRELVIVRAQLPSSTDIYHKNLKRVVYVTGDVAGADCRKPGLRHSQDEPMPARPASSCPTDTLSFVITPCSPESTDHYSMKWDGEWQITIEVFRDLGLAFAAVLVLIYVLVVGLVPLFHLCRW